VPAVLPHCTSVAAGTSAASVNHQHLLNTPSSSLATVLKLVLSCVYCTSVAGTSCVTTCKASAVALTHERAQEQPCHCAVATACRAVRPTMCCCRHCRHTACVKQALTRGLAQRCFATVLMQQCLQCRILHKCCCRHSGVQQQLHTLIYVCSSSLVLC
jgi:hypothetical protein